MSDRARGKTHGFLQMLSQVRIAPDGAISAVPLPPRQTGIVRPTFNPLVINDGTADQYLTWSARDPELDRTRGAASPVVRNFANILWSTDI